MNLGRDVAIKILPAEFTHELERLAASNVKRVFLPR
jgi:hypothetical protein